MGIKFYKYPLAVDQNNYLTKIVSVQIVYDLGACPKIIHRSLTLKDGLFGATFLVKDCHKGNYVYSVYGVAFAAEGEWRFNNDYVRNVIIFIVYKSSSFHADNLKNNLLLLGERDTFGFIGSTGAADGKCRINFSKESRNFCFNAGNSQLFINEKEIFKFKTNNKSVNFPIQFCLGSVSNRSTKSGEGFFHGCVYDFTVAYNSLEKSDILKSLKYLMKKNKIK